jgi:3-oxoacyl-[acyl-carrier-protein] synthase-3
MENIKKVLIHQANEKMDEAILRKLGQLYDLRLDAKDMMPMTIQKFGNNSVATVPVMLDKVVRGEIEGHELKEGDDIILASVGAGMHINAIIYRM